VAARASALPSTAALVAAAGAVGLFAGLGLALWMSARPAAPRPVDPSPREPAARSAHPAPAGAPAIASAARTTAPPPARPPSPVHAPDRGAPIAPGGAPSVAVAGGGPAGAVAPPARGDGREVLPVVEPPTIAPPPPGPPAPTSPPGTVSSPPPVSASTTPAPPPTLALSPPAAPPAVAPPAPAHAGPPRPAAPASPPRAVAVVDPADAFIAESRALGAAIEALRTRHDAAAARRALDRYRLRYHRGQLAAEASRIEVELLLVEGRPGEALARLTALTGPSLDASSLVLRGELRLRDHPADAARDLTSALERAGLPADLAGRALYGRALARRRLGDGAGADDDLRACLQRDPAGDLCGPARAALTSTGGN